MIDETNVRDLPGARRLLVVVFRAPGVRLPYDFKRKTSWTKAVPVLAFRPAGISPRGLPGLNAGSTIEQPAYENEKRFGAASFLVLRLNHCFYRLVDSKKQYTKRQNALTSRANTVRV